MMKPIFSILYDYAFPAIIVHMTNMKQYSNVTAVTDKTRLTSRYSRFPVL